MTASPVAGGGVDVLAVMQASADQLWRYRRDILAREEEAARAAVAELIAADKEYDEARAAFDALRDGASTLGDVMCARGALRRAQARRAAALSNIEGAST